MDDATAQAIMPRVVHLEDLSAIIDVGTGIAFAAMLWAVRKGHLSLAGFANILGQLLLAPAAGHYMEEHVMGRERIEAFFRQGPAFPPPGMHMRGHKASPAGSSGTFLPVCGSLLCIGMYFGTLGVGERKHDYWPVLVSSAAFWWLVVGARLNATLGGSALSPRGRGYLIPILGCPTLVFIIIVFSCMSVWIYSILAMAGESHADGNIQKQNCFPEGIKLQEPAAETAPHALPQPPRSARREIPLLLDLHSPGLGPRTCSSVSSPATDIGYFKAGADSFASPRAAPGIESIQTPQRRKDPPGSVVCLTSDSDSDSAECRGTKSVSSFSRMSAISSVRGSWPHAGERHTGSPFRRRPLSASHADEMLTSGSEDESTDDDSGDFSTHYSLVTPRASSHSPTPRGGAWKGSGTMRRRTQQKAETCGMATAPFGGGGGATAPMRLRSSGSMSPTPVRRGVERRAISSLSPTPPLRSSSLQF